MKRFLIALCITSLMAASFSFAADNSAISDQLKLTARVLMQKVPEPTIGSVGGEWTMIGLARSTEMVPDSYAAGYYSRVVSELKGSGGVITTIKYTEYSRVILALTALGYDVKNVGGYDLLEKLADFDAVIRQGINGPVFALIALDSRSYDIPIVSEISNRTTRQKLVDYILERECTAGGVRGGFSLGLQEPQADVTAMALQALSKYTSQPRVSAAVDRGIKTLAVLENNASSSLWNENSAESAAQIIVAKSALNIDAKKNVEDLLKFSDNTGGFRNIEKSGFDLMTTEQAFYALAAYERYLNGWAPLYDMTGEISVVLNGVRLGFDAPPINADGRVLVPMRAIFEALGAEVAWDDSARTVTGKTDKHTVSLKIGESSAILDGNRVPLDAPAQISGNRTMVPVRFIAESLDAKVNWDSKSSTVYINK